MNIKSMTAFFGNLDGKKLEPGTGLTIITAPNESGKSTWAGFLKAMLYGINTRESDKKGSIADKNRYQPWSGAPMEGELTMQWQGRDITLRRGPKGRTPFGEFTAVYTGTAELVPALFSDTCGEFIAGVGREVYERSAFIGAGIPLSINSAPELERRIAALVSTGQEEISYSQVESQLKEWQRRRKHNNSGMIPRMMNELEEVETVRRRLARISEDISVLAQTRQTLRTASAELEDWLESYRRLDRHELNARYAQAQDALDTAKAQLSDLDSGRNRQAELPSKEELKRAQGEIAYLTALDSELRQADKALTQAQDALDTARTAGEDSRFVGQSGEEATLRGEADVSQFNALSTRITQLKKRPLICTIVVAGTFGLSMVAGQFVTLPSPYIPLAVTALAALGAVVVLMTGRSAQKRSRAEMAQLLARYNVTEVTEIPSQTQDYRSRQQLADDAALALRQVRSGIEDRRARRTNGWDDLIAFVHTFAPEVTALFGCSAALSRALGADDQHAMAHLRVEGAQRLFDELSAQGGQAFQTMEFVTQPPLPKAETAARLRATRDELSRVERELAQRQGEQSAVGDPAALAAQEECLRRDLAQRQMEYDALTMALEGLRRANVRLQERFSPELNRIAGDYFARLTGGKYESISLTRELEASAIQTGGIMPRRSLSLSRGTADQMYLAVRLAVCDLCLPAEEGVPLILDDALTAFDDERLELALSLLLELSEKRQILLFSCQKREGAFFQSNPNVTNLTL